MNVCERACVRMDKKRERVCELKRERERERERASLLYVLSACCA